MAEYYEVAGEAGVVDVGIGTKVELWSGAGPGGWGEVIRLLPERRVEIRRSDDGETYVAAVDGDRGDGGELRDVYVTDWSPEMASLMAAWRRWHTAPAQVDHYDVKGVGEVSVGTKLEAWDGTANDEDLDWGEVTRLLAGRRVEIHWYGEGEAAASEIDDVCGLVVDDWSGEIYDRLRKRAKDQGHGQV